MKTLIRLLLLTGAVCALALSGFAQVVSLYATISSTQETTGSTSAAIGTADMDYNVADNTFDLVITLNGMTNTLLASHIHEAAVGVAGGVVTGLGDETVYTRNGNTLTATFRHLTYGGTPKTLLQNGAYVNFHSAAFPGGEVRGQLIAETKRLYANLSASQSVSATPVVSNAKGAAILWYNSGTNKLTVSINILGFTNTFSNSHIHEAAVGANGGVVTPFGGASAYTAVGGFYCATFSNLTYAGDPIKLLTGGAYINTHSNVYPAGEIRGQIWASDDMTSSRLVAVSSRGLAGTGDQTLITGMVVTGPAPVVVRVAARGPSLTAFGVGGALADPVLSLTSQTGMLYAWNDNSSTTGYNSKDSVINVILPPGIYTALVGSANSTTGVALVEAIELGWDAPPF